MLHTRLLRTALTLVAGAWLAGCAGNPWTIQPGMSQAQLQALGKPTATWPLAGATRWQYSWQPLGRKVYNIDVNASGEVVRVEQSLQPRAFERVVIGVWGTAELLREWGEPAEKTRLARFDGTVWTWRWEENGNPRFFHVHLNPAGIAVQAYSADEIFNAPDKS